MLQRQSVEVIMVRAKPHSAFAWTGDFLFTLAPVLNATFTDKSFFNGDNTDLISNSGSNFTIPSYSFVEDEEEDE
ncbi:MAG: hypothetical protein Q7S68_06025 [Deltaproteobacteria bacterium]|nr:hypothetical protein [Deltaproteobacteria bacterium]